MTTATHQTFSALIKPNAPPCEHCGTPCGVNDYGDFVCVGDPNCFYLDVNGAICANCGDVYENHGFGMGNVDDRVAECLKG